MGVRLQWSGLQEFRSALRELPEDLASEAEAIVVAHATEAERTVIAGYPEGPTGNLKRGVRLQVEGSKVGVRATLRSRAFHAHLFERGSGRRRTRTGANRGSMPAAPEQQRLVPKAIRVRARMTRALISLVERAGFKVQQR